jgi:hypothetical protein
MGTDERGWEWIVVFGARHHLEEVYALKGLCILAPGIALVIPQSSTKRDTVTTSRRLGSH